MMSYQFSPSLDCDTTRAISKNKNTTPGRKAMTWYLKVKPD
jgi:hypothetical protein